MNNSIIIFGSSRSNGNTRNAIDNVIDKANTEIPIMDLANFNVNDFNYEYDQNDDFPDLISSVLNYDLIMLATPIYWYSVSARMKRFIDRLTDLLTLNKKSGHRLRGKQLATIASYNTYPDGSKGFEQTLINTASYLGMRYRGTYLHYSGEEHEGVQASNQSLERFIQILLAPEFVEPGAT